MKQKPNPPTDEKRPENQTDEDAGTVQREQVTEHNIQRKDLPRGSEPETRASSSHRR